MFKLYFLLFNIKLSPKMTAAYWQWDFRTGFVLMFYSATFFVKKKIL